MVKLVYCLDQKNGLAKAGKMAWNVPSEMAHFRQLTMNQIVVMGRKTFESIGHPLPYRQNIVLSRDQTYQTNFAMVEVMHDVQTLTNKYAQQDIYVIGGKEIYEQLYPIADEIIVSYLNADYACDVQLNFDYAEFKLVKNDHFPEFEVYYYARTISRTNNFCLEIPSFNGPLDLLWNLIVEKKLDVNDLDVVLLTKQYLHFIEQNINYIEFSQVSDYLLMASQLIALKAASLLPKAAVDSHINNFEYERMKLINRLLAYKQYQKSLRFFRKKQIARGDFFIRKDDDFADYSLDQKWLKRIPKALSVEKLYESLQALIARRYAQKFKEMKLKVQEINVEWMKEIIINFLHEKALHEVVGLEKFVQLMVNNTSVKQFFLAAFLALLSLAKEQQIVIFENETDYQLYFHFNHHFKIESLI